MLPTSCWIGLGCWFVLFNLINYFAMGIDKLKAKKNKYRTPEKNFFIFSALGGAFGCLLGMYQFRHKTQHKSFTIGIPALAVWNVILYGGLIYLMSKYMAS